MTCPEKKPDDLPSANAAPASASWTFVGCTSRFYSCDWHGSPRGGGFGRIRGLTVRPDLGRWPGAVSARPPGRETHPGASDTSVTLVFLVLVGVVTNPTKQRWWGCNNPAKQRWDPAESAG